MLCINDRAPSAELNEDYEVCATLLDEDVVYNDEEQDCKDVHFWIDVPRDQDPFSGPGLTSSSPLFVQGYRSHGARSFNPNPNPPDTYIQLLILGRLKHLHLFLAPLLKLLSNRRPAILRLLRYHQILPQGVISPPPWENVPPIPTLVHFQAECREHFRICAKDWWLEHPGCQHWQIRRETTG